MSARLHFRLKLAAWLDKLFGIDCVHLTRDEFEEWQDAVILRHGLLPDRRPSGRLPSEKALHEMFEAGKLWGAKQIQATSPFQTEPIPQLPSQFPLPQKPGDLARWHHRQQIDGPTKLMKAVAPSASMKVPRLISPNEEFLR